MNLKWLGTRLVDGAAALTLLFLIFEGPTVYAIAKDKIMRRRAH